MRKGKKEAKLSTRKNQKSLKISPQNKEAKIKKPYRESESIYKKLVESSLQGIVIAQGLPPRLIYANPAISRMLGYSSDELNSLTSEQIENLLHPDDRLKFFNQYKDLLEEKSKGANYEIRRIRKDGNTVWLELSATQIEYNGEPAVLATYIDNTERKRAEKTLRESEEKYRTILENIEDGYFEVDLAGNFTFFNDAICRMLGYFRDEMMGMNNRKYTDPENAIKLYQAFNNVYRTGIPVKGFEWEVIRKDGAKRYSEVSISLIRNSKGQPIGFRGIARDTTERKKAEEALALSEERYRTLVEESFDGIFIRKGPKIVFANRRLYEMLGYREGELEGLDHWLVYHPEYQALIRERAQARMRGESVPSPYEVKFLRKDGSSFWGEIQPKVIRFLGEPGLQVWARDNSERKRAEETLRVERERFRSLSESAPFGMAMIDKDGLFKYINPKFKELLGYDLNDIPDGKTWFRKTCPDSDYRHQVISAWLEDSGSSKPGERMPRVFTVKCKDGSEKIIKFISVKSESGETLMTCENITERIRAEEAVRESEEYLNVLVNSLHTGIMVVDSETHNIVDVNKHVMDITGSSKEEILGKVCHQYICPAEIGKCPITDLKQTIDCSEHIIIKANGEQVPILKSVVSVIHKGRQYLIESFVDLTEWKKIEKEMVSLQEQLRHSQKMEAIGRLAGGIAHDFSNLLTVIKGYAELSFPGLDTGDPLRGNIEEILKASERASNLTHKLLTFSRRQILEFKVINLNALLKDLDRMLHRILGEDIKLVYHLAKDIGKVKTDLGQIEQAVLNLAVNARDAMPSGGKLTIETSNVELSEAYAQTHIEVTLGRYVMISVSDSGAGMTPEVRERIFEPFFTTKEKGKGTGLGLSTVYGIVKQSGGNINVYSEPGLGTTFKIYLPRVEEEEDHLQRKDYGISLSTGDETILLAEDEQAVRELTARILRERGYQVYEAPDGREALAIAQRHPDRKIHLLLTDVVMPGMGGKELAEQLKLSTPDIKVLFISGYTDNAIVHHGILEEGINYIQKPFTIGILAKKIRQVLDS